MNENLGSKGVSAHSQKFLINNYIINSVDNVIFYGTEIDSGLVDLVISLWGSIQFSCVATLTVPSLYYCHWNKNQPPFIFVSTVQCISNQGQRVNIATSTILQQFYSFYTDTSQVNKSPTQRAYSIYIWIGLIFWGWQLHLCYSSKVSWWWTHSSCF